jgi:hypothetical protein
MSINGPKGLGTDSGSHAPQVHANVRRQRRAELGHQRRLARTRLATHEHQTAVAVGRLAEPGMQRSELWLALD